MTQFSFNDIKTSLDDMNTIIEITKRAKKLCPELNPLSLSMDVMACHASTPLDLAGLLSGNNLDFIHDIYGINQHLNRQTGRLDGLFVPRYAKNQ